jgi:hypothetical protein
MLLKSVEYLDESAFLEAAQYCADRPGDTANLMNSLKWEPGNTSRVVVCRYLGYSLVWDLRGDTLHACHTDFEFLFKGEIYLIKMQQYIAFILARHW